jgi:hypothetical protein
MMKRTSPSSQTVVRWTFRYGSNVLTCGVERHAEALYVLSVVPNDGSHVAMVETFDSSVAALRRHAVIAACLRDRGWALVGYTGAQIAESATWQRAA